MPICANKIRNDPASDDQGHSLYSQQIQLNGMNMPTRFPLSDPFCPSAILSSKQILPTDNIGKSKMASKIIINLSG